MRVDPAQRTRFIDVLGELNDLRVLHMDDGPIITSCEVSNLICGQRGQPDRFTSLRQLRIATTSLGCAAFLGMLPASGLLSLHWRVLKDGHVFHGSTWKALEHCGRFSVNNLTLVIPTKLTVQECRDDSKAMLDTPHLSRPTSFSLKAAIGGHVLWLDRAGFRFGDRVTDFGMKDVEWYTFGRLMEDMPHAVQLQVGDITCREGRPSHLIQIYNLQCGISTATCGV